MKNSLGNETHERARIRWTAQIGLLSRRTSYLLGAASTIPIMGLMMWLTAYGGFDLVDFFVNVLFYLVYVLFTMRLVGMGLDFSADGVAVHNFFRTRRFAWGQIERFQIKNTLTGFTTSPAWLVTRDHAWHKVRGIAESNWSVAGCKTDTSATRAVDALNGLLEQVRREGYDPSINRFNAWSDQAAQKLTDG